MNPQEISFHFLKCYAAATIHFDRGMSVLMYTSRIHLDLGAVCAVLYSLGVAIYYARSTNNNNNNNKIRPVINKIFIFFIIITLA